MITDSLEVLSKLDVFYNNALDHILYTLIALFSAAVAVVGVIMPWVFGMWQRKDYKVRIEELKTDFNKKIKTANADYDNKLMLAGNSLDNKIEEAQINLSAKINSAENELNRIINSVEKELNTKNDELRSHLLERINEDISKAKEDTLKDFIKRIEGIQSQSEIFKGFSEYIVAKEFYTQERYLESFYKSIEASQKLIQNESELAELSTKLVIKSYELMKDPNLLEKWSKSLEEKTQQMINGTKNNQKFENSYEHIYELRKKIIKKLTPKATDPQ